MAAAVIASRQEVLAEQEDVVGIGEERRYQQGIRVDRPSF
jgi:hypothetical protein